MSTQKYYFTLILLIISTSPCSEGETKNSLHCYAGKQFPDCEIRLIGDNNSSTSICIKPNTFCHKISNSPETHLNTFCANKEEIKSLENSHKFKKEKYIIKKIQSNCEEKNHDGLYCEIKNEENYTGVCLNKKCQKRCQEKTGECPQNENCYWANTKNIPLQNPSQIKHEELGVRICLEENYEFSNDYFIGEKSCEMKEDKEACFLTVSGSFGYCYANECLESCPSVYPRGFVECEEGSCYTWNGFLEGEQDFRNDQFCLKGLGEGEGEFQLVVVGEEEFLIV